jgi:catechol 2,3-dioxygenase-like lactoylglutathione lyase family enzyme
MSLHLNQVLLSCTDVTRAIAFYRGLGLTLIVRKVADDVDIYARFIVPGNQATLSLMRDRMRLQLVSRSLSSAKTSMSVWLGSRRLATSSTPTPKTNLTCGARHTCAIPTAIT